MKQLFSLFLGGLFLFSCSETVEQPVAPSVGEPMNIRIRLNATPMTSVGGKAATRAVGNEGDALSVQWRAGQTRAAGDKTAAESKIHKAWLLQFNGTAGTSTLMAAPQVLTPDAEGYSDCQMIGGSTTNRVYVVANVNESVVNAWSTFTTLSAFESTAFEQGVLSATEVETKGLPMLVYKDFIPSDVLPGDFQLKSRMAKLTFQYTIKAGLSLPPITATLHGVPNKLSCKVSDPADAAQQPAGATYDGTYDLTAAHSNAMTVYVPENLAGRKSDITTELQRTTANAMANSMYIEVGGEKEENNQFAFALYVIYLGDIIGNKGDFNVQGNCAYDVVVSIKGTNGVVDKRVESGIYQNLSWDAAKNEAATANCYVVTAAGNYYIDATVMGNGAFTPAHTASAVPGDANFDAIIPSKLNPVSADVLWESVNTATAPAKGAIARDAKIYKGSKLLFSAGAAGNAVIAAKDASGTILWSWHIWRITDTPVGVTLASITDGAGFIAPTLKMMDRNLGALRATPNTNVTVEQDYGLFYQWGRKDPFQTQGAVTTAPGGTGITPADAVKKPTTFYIVGSDWTTRNDNLWGCPLTEKVTINDNTFNKNAGSKTIYDPCPVGWKVMPAYAFANATIDNSPWDATNKGRNFAVVTTSADTPFFLSASGRRNCSNGTLVNVGTYGVYWATSPKIASTSYGSLLGFGDGSVYPTVNFRADGYGVRCVQE